MTGVLYIIPYIKHFCLEAHYGPAEAQTHAKEPRCWHGQHEKPPCVHSNASVLIVISQTFIVTVMTSMFSSTCNRPPPSPLTHAPFSYSSAALASPAAINLFAVDLFVPREDDIFSLVTQWTSGSISRSPQPSPPVDFYCRPPQKGFWTAIKTLM